MSRTELPKWKITVKREKGWPKIPTMYADSEEQRLALVLKWHFAAGTKRVDCKQIRGKKTGK